MEKKNYKVLFIDLDGTLIKTKSKYGPPKGIWDMEIQFNVLDAIKMMFPEHVYIISNQGGVEKGVLNILSIRSKIKYICRIISDYCGISYVDFTICPYNDKNDPRRKPNTGMLEEFAYQDIDGERKVPKFPKSECVMVGDASGLPGQFSDSDKKTAENFGIDYMDVEEFIKTYK